MMSVACFNFSCLLLHVFNRLECDCSNSLRHLLPFENSLWSSLLQASRTSFQWLSRAALCATARDIFWLFLPEPSLGPPTELLFVALELLHLAFGERCSCFVAAAICGMSTPCSCFATTVVCNMLAACSCSGEFEPFFLLENLHGLHAFS